MNVESDCAIAIATLCDWFKNLTLVYQPMKRKTKTNHDLHTRFFPRFEQVTQNCYEFGLVHCAVKFAPVVICRSNSFGICFTTLN